MTQHPIIVPVANTHCLLISELQFSCCAVAALQRMLALNGRYHSQPTYWLEASHMERDNIDGRQVGLLCAVSYKRACQQDQQ